MSYQFSVITPDTNLWQKIEQSPDSSCFFSSYWDAYLRKMGTKPFIVEIKENGASIGHFIGSRRWIGLRMVSAPSMGTGTYAQGLCMQHPVSEEKRVAIYQELTDWMLRTHKADYIQICDWQLRTDSNDWIDDWCNPILDASGIHYQPRQTYYVDLRPSEDELWASLHYKSCKYAINKARKLGLYVRRIERREDIDAFVKQHHSHIVDVLRRKGNRGLPCQSEKNISALCHTLFPNRILMLEVLGPTEDGQLQSMSSCIFTIDKGVCSYFTAASYQRFMHYCPNELMAWEGIKHLNNLGCTTLILGGLAQYKRKFSPIYAFVPVMIFSRFKFMNNARVIFKRIYWRIIHIFK